MFAITVILDSMTMYKLLFNLLHYYIFLYLMIIIDRIKITQMTYFCQLIIKLVIFYAIADATNYV